LNGIKRLHTAETALSSFQTARQVGFENINLDLMFSLPSQSHNDWIATLETAVGLAPEHLSCYSLIVEDGTLLAKDKSFKQQSDEADRAMYYAAKDILKAAGYAHYEISNFAKPGRECRHNMAYWTGADYIGLGLGAHSYVNGERFNNTESFEEYLTCRKRENVQILTDDDKRFEFIMLGLRLISGISEKEFESRFGKSLDYFYESIIIELINNGLLKRGGGRIQLTTTGIDLSNQVFVKFL